MLMGSIHLAIGGNLTTRDSLFPSFDPVVSDVSNVAVSTPVRTLECHMHLRECMLGSCDPKRSDPARSRDPGMPSQERDAPEGTRANRISSARTMNGGIGARGGVHAGRREPGCVIRRTSNLTVPMIRAKEPGVKTCGLKFVFRVYRSVNVDPSLANAIYISASYKRSFVLLSKVSKLADSGRNLGDRRTGARETEETSETEGSR
jgi:hypothetical protein